MRFFSLVWRQLQSEVRSPRFLALSATVALLALFAVQAGSVNLGLRQQIADELLRQRTGDQARNRGRIAGLDVEPGLREVRDPNPLSVFVQGIDSALPAYWDFSPSRVMPGPSAQVPQSVTSSGMSLDLEFLIRLVLGLLALLIGLDSLVHDRDSGTLHAVLSQPIPSWTVLASKMTAGAVALGVSLALLLAGSMIGTRFWVPNLYSPELVQFFAAIFAVGFLYLLVLLFAGFAVAATMRSSRMITSISVVVWVYVVLLAPLLIPLVRTALAIPQQALAAQLQGTYAREFRATQELIGDQLAESTPPGTDIRQLRRIDEATADKLEDLWGYRADVLRGTLDAHEREAELQAARQRQAIRLLMFMSPASQLTEGLSSIAGTGSLLQERWEAAIKTRQRTVNEMVFDDQPRVTLLVPQDLGRIRFGFDRREQRLFSEIPRFDPPSSALRSRIDDAVPNLAVLGAYAGVLLAWAFLAFSRRPL